jgi:hypothetical protein
MSTSTQTPPPISGGGLVKAIWAVVVALVAAAGTIFWAGYNWADFNRKINKIDDVERRLSYLENLPPPDAQKPTNSFLSDGGKYLCPEGSVLTGINTGSVHTAVWCSRLRAPADQSRPTQ